MKNWHAHKVSIHRKAYQNWLINECFTNNSAKKNPRVPLFVLCRRTCVLKNCYDRVCLVSIHISYFKAALRILSTVRSKNLLEKKKNQMLVTLYFNLGNSSFKFKSCKLFYKYWLKLLCAVLQLG